MPTDRIWQVLLGTCHTLPTKSNSPEAFVCDPLARCKGQQLGQLVSYILGVPGRLPEKLGWAKYPQEEPEREASVLLDSDYRLWVCGGCASIHGYQGSQTEGRKITFPKQNCGKRQRQPLKQRVPGAVGLTFSEESRHSRAWYCDRHSLASNYINWEILTYGWFYRTR